MYKNKLANSGFLMIAIIFISFTLRAPITSIGPLANLIHDDLGVSNGFVGFITTLPLLAFAICSPFISKISNGFGIGRTMLAGLLVIAAGGVIRSYTGIFGLLIGTALMGVGIAIGNVLIPSMVKLKFPNKIGIVTSIYVTCMGVFASVGAGISYPLAAEMGFGWKNALVVWSVVAFVAIIIWLPQLRLDSEPDVSKLQTKTVSEQSWESERKIQRKNIWKSPLAWCLTMFLGLQSLNFYSITAWLPSILNERGMSAEVAGYMALWFQLSAIPASFIVPILSSKIKNQKNIVVGACTLYFIGLVILLMDAPFLAVMMALGFISLGGGASFSWSMVMMSLRAGDSQEAAELSGMSQSIGYLLAAAGPTMCGVIYDVTNSWTFIIVLFFIIAVLMAIFGIQGAKKEKLFY